MIATEQKLDIFLLSSYLYYINEGGELRLRQSNRQMFQKISNIKLIIVSGISGLILATIMSSISEIKSTEVMLFQLSFTKENALQLIGEWGQKGVESFKRTIWIDYFFIISYSFFLSGSIAVLINRKYESSRNVHFFLFAIPFIAGFCDFIENTLHIVSLSNINNFSEALIFIASIFALVKWSLVLFCILIISYFRFFR